jgi:hypothetical protein
MTPEEKRKLYSTGIYGGLGLAATSILIDLWRSHKRYAKAKELKDENQALRLYLPGYGDTEKAEKLASEPLLKQAGLTEWLIAALLGGATYYGTNTAYRGIRKDQLDKEIEEESKQYVDSLQGLGKVAFDDIPKDLFYLGLLAGGAGTYGILENTFPTVKEKPMAGQPKKIVVRGFGTVKSDKKQGDLIPLKDMIRQYRSLFGKDPSQSLAKQRREIASPPEEPQDKEEKRPSEEEKEEQLKAAFWVPFGKVDYQKAACFAALCCASRCVDSSPLAEIFGRAIEDKSAARMETAADELGMLGLIDSCKGSWQIYKAASESEKIAAVSVVMASGTLRPSIAMLTAAEIADFSPSLAKQARELLEDESLGILGVKVASSMFENSVETAGNEPWAEQTLTSPEEVPEGQKEVGDKDPIDQYMDEGGGGGIISENGTGTNSTTDLGSPQRGRDQNNGVS